MQSLDWDYGSWSQPGGDNMVHDFRCGVKGSGSCAALDLALGSPSRQVHGAV